MPNNNDYLRYHWTRIQQQQPHKFPNPNKPIAHRSRIEFGRKDLAN